MSGHVIDSQTQKLRGQVPAGKESSQAVTGKLLFRWVVLGLIFLGIFMPIIPMVIWSVSFRWFFPDLIPELGTGEQFLRAWRYVFSSNSQIGEALFASSYIAIIVTSISIIISIPAGRALGLYKFRGKRFVEFMILAPVIVPGLAVSLGIHVAFIRLGLADKIIGVLLVHLVPTIPYMVSILASVFSNYDVDFEGQARSLGAKPIQTFRYITLPAILPGIMVGGLFAFLISWSQYITTLLIGGGRVVTLPLLLFSFAGTNDRAITAALSIVFMAPALVILAFSSRFLTGKSGTLGGFGRL